MREKILAFLQNHSKTHITKREIAERLDVDPQEKRAFRQAIQQLIEEGILLPVKKNFYGIQGRSNMLTGKLQCHRSGFGFLLPDPECNVKGDVFISGANLGEAIHGDRVMVQLIQPRTESRQGRAPTGGRHPKTEGKVTRILERGKSRLVGKILFFKKPLLIPLDSRYHNSISIIETGELPLTDGDIVYVELTSEPGVHTRPQGRVLALVCKPDDPELPLKVALARHEIPTEFPAAALAEAKETPREISASEISGRIDFRQLPVVTIDGETAFDFDDAVNVQKQADGNFILGVHIADVSHYVKSGSALDAEAFRRGTSVYFPDRAVSMLPHELSSDICSLLPDQDRLTFSARLVIDGRNGKTLNAHFTPSIIRSRARMTYTQVSKILEGDVELLAQFHDQADHFRLMAELSTVLQRRRKRRGSIDFDLPTEEVRYDRLDNIIGIFRAERTLAHRIIEEFMIAANEAVAEFFTKRKLPFIYRIHDEPDPLKVQEFAEVASRFGHNFPTGEESFKSKDFQQMAECFDESPVGKYLSYLMLRSFKLAVYSEENRSHFGLASRNYTHFTSPIRRYPDLVVHRLLRCALAGNPLMEADSRLIAGLAVTARQSSERERETMEAEREILAWKKAEFMNTKLGEEFTGFISGMRPNGFFVELTDFFVEGFINLSTLEDDYYIFEEDRHLFRGERTGQLFQLGAPVRVRVDRVDQERYWIDFSLLLTAKGASSPITGGNEQKRPRRPGLTASQTKESDRTLRKTPRRRRRNK